MPMDHLHIHFTKSNILITVLLPCLLISSTLPSFFCSLTSVRDPHLFDRNLPRLSLVQLTDLFNQTLCAAEKAVQFMFLNADKTNLDGAIGPLILKSVVTGLLSNHWTDLSADFVTRLRQVEEISDSTAEKISVTAFQQTPYYAKRMYRLMDPYFWSVYYPINKVSLDLVSATRSRKESYTEKKSDDCILEFENDDNKARCQMSDKCWTMMMQPGLTQYSLTHQLFYLQNGISLNCLSEMETKAISNPPFESVQSLMTRLCSNIFYEAIKVEENGFPTTYRDLFMEQIGLCSYVGYIQVAQLSWLPKILSWQRENGCYGAFPGEKINNTNFDPKSYGNYRRKRSVIPSFVDSSVHVSKRAEKLMTKDKCFSHRTAVALTALAGYLRALGESIFAVFNGEDGL